ncbi:hypothetical protein EV383_1984 [Pseudonocardia sediminis]|uniref:Uncharacterized protein n=1 Tax=Pseudonocardia sediminis TaxID=1397368 RepID=A0A4V2FQK6_PSEST|nr:hypothetical protein [Pseudonocardia sediminis]RZT85120.1 hypothetical protein EV383_1984 [Pseudonocardia sediminis]
MTTAACPSPSTTRSATTDARLTGTRVTTFVRTAWLRWWERRDVLIPVGPEPAGPWAAADRPDRDRARIRVELARG